MNWNKSFFRWMRFIGYLLVAISCYALPLSMLENRSFCIFSNLFNVECFGCGFTHAFFAFIHGDLLQALTYHKLVLVFPMILVLILQDCWTIVKNVKKQSWLETGMTTIRVFCYGE